MVGENELSIPGRMLDLYALRHKLIAHNIANSDVPGFRKLEAEFDGELRKALSSNDPESSLKTLDLKVTRAAEQGVDTDSEVAEMGKNKLLYDTFAQIAQFRLRMLRAAIAAK